MNTKVPFRFGLGDRPPISVAALVGVQHLLAVFGGIVTAPLLIALGMQLPPDETAYLISSALFVSGLATLLQISRIGPIGSGLLSIQGTSFTFVGPLIYLHQYYAADATSEYALSVIFTACLISAVVIALISPFIGRLRRVLTSNVSASIVLLLGITLVWTTIGNIRREILEYTEAGAPVWHTYGITVAIVALILWMATRSNGFLRMASVVAGLVVGSILAAAAGWLSVPDVSNTPSWFLPTFARFEVTPDWTAILVLMPVFLVSATESIGDLTATGNLSGISTRDGAFFRRLRGGILADALNSAAAALLATFPNTTFSQNNGVIRLTGVSSRRVGRIVALLLVVLGATPVIAAWVQAIPALVIASATLLMFVMVVISGYQIAQTAGASKRDYSIIGVSVVAGLCMTLPPVVALLERVPDNIAVVFGFPVSAGALFAVAMDAAVPGRTTKGV